MATITCEDCGRDYETTRKNTKYCRSCRVYRDLMFLGERRKECIECEKTFNPLTTKDLLCGRCGDFMRKAPEGECKLCGESAKLLHESIQVCGACATDPAKRVTFLRALAKKRRQS